jgi:hypothetical protein
MPYSDRAPSWVGYRRQKVTGRARSSRPCGTRIGTASKPKWREYVYAAATAMFATASSPRIPPNHGAPREGMDGSCPWARPRLPRRQNGIAALAPEILDASKPAGFGRNSSAAPHNPCPCASKLSLSRIYPRARLNQRMTEGNADSDFPLPTTMEASRTASGDPIQWTRYVVLDGDFVALACSPWSGPAGSTMASPPAL